jgi:hypothetical protein
MSERVEPDVVHVTPTPPFTRLYRFDDRVLDGVEMLGRVTVLGIVTAPDVTARHA